ncbi:hypothetical protein ONS95_007605 [Cadophora gregata]|uniref:uncharacterized protein n=1 Tax=Cadophora gregata TaxID=51156 RepID=UPI0026DB6A66|nr:uncharacterized protein ONS95_007605 [Cadophora gregata]KAK0118717.1 hypothetical protein ONS96_011805 [Cadophora gregata f. sp. sojae]KAK0125982.1 hypothetical protein ONS95_007605 [Cadophora gregata]
MAEDSLQVLVKALHDHDLPCDREAIISAFADPESKPAIQAWVDEYLSPETLLTKDEANLYAVLTKSGEADTLAAHDLSLVQEFSDQEIQSAIEQLKRSTAAIEKQSEALRLQQNAMNSLVRSEKRTSQARSHTERDQLRKWDVEKGHITATIEELSQSLTYQTTDLEQQCKASEAGIKQTVDSILKSDDKLLLSLQKLSSDLEHGRSDDEETIARIRELCARLIKHRVEGIRTRLDRVYLEGLAGSKASNDHAEEEEANDLQEELESLYTEILPVAQMSAEQQFLEPALRAIAASDGQGQERTVQAVKYIHDCMIFLVNRIETFLERAEESQCHKMALKAVIISANKELPHRESAPAIKPSSPTRPNTQRRRKSSASQSTLRVRNTRRSSGHFDEDIEPEQQLARNLGVALPPEGVSNHERANLLERMLAERLIRLEGHAASLQSTTESSTSSHLLDARMTLGLLHDSLLSKSLYHKVQLLDPNLEAAVTNFEQEVQHLEDDLEAVDLHSLQARNVHREQFIERWSR